MNLTLKCPSSLDLQKKKEKKVWHRATCPSLTPLCTKEFCKKKKKNCFDQSYITRDIPIFRHKRDTLYVRSIFTLLRIKRYINTIDERKRFNNNFLIVKKEKKDNNNTTLNEVSRFLKKKELKN